MRDIQAIEDIAILTLAGSNRRKPKKVGIMRVWARKLLKRVVGLLAIIAVVLLVVRAYDSQRGEPLEPWHTYVPTELDVEELDQGGWTEYLKAEAAIFDSVR